MLCSSYDSHGCSIGSHNGCALELVRKRVVGMSHCLFIVLKISLFSI